MIRSLPMSVNLSLPLDAVTQKLAFLGRTGSGKTYAATKLAELFGDAGAQFIVIDPVGKWWGLRLAADGRSAGLDVPVFGGLHGDLPLEPVMGARIADLIIDRQLSAVLDVSQFEHNTDKARFAEAFATRLFFRKKSAPSAVHLFVEEAQEFCPQHAMGEEKRMLGAFERLIKLGRNFGIGASLISQRPQEINKKALNQTECLFVFQTTGVHERKAIDAWISDKGIEEDIAALLPSLSTGEARVWSPAWLRISKTVMIGKKRTFDASATPKVGARTVEARALTPIDIAEITKSLADVVERAKADDPRELRRRIAELEKRPAPEAGLTKDQERALGKLLDEVTGIRGCLPKLDDEIRKVRGLFEGFKIDTEGMAARVERLVMTVRAAAVLGPDAGRVDRVQFRDAGRAPPTNGVAKPPAMARKPTGAATSTSGEELSKGQLTVLQRVVQLGTLTRGELSTLTSYRRSTRNRLISELSALGCVRTEGQSVTATDEGRRRCGSIEELPIGDDLREWWIARLNEGQSKMLKAVAAVYPQEAARTDLDDATGYARSTRNRLLSELSAAKLVTATGRDSVRASDKLFDRPGERSR